MKKLLLVLTAVAVSLAFVGIAVAKGPIGCPPPCDYKMVTEYMPPPVVPTHKVPKMKPPTAPTCKQTCNGCITIPGSKYALWDSTEDVPTVVKKDVYQDLCVGKSKGQCMPCGFCVPVKWDCKWKTSVICGTVDVTVWKPQPTTYPIPVTCKPVPCPPPDCF
jgi:hypothetical protein